MSVDHEWIFQGAVLLFLNRARRNFPENWSQWKFLGFRCGEGEWTPGIGSNNQRGDLLGSRSDLSLGLCLPSEIGVSQPTMLLAAEQAIIVSKFTAGLSLVPPLGCNQAWRAFAGWNSASA